MVNPEITSIILRFVERPKQQGHSRRESSDLWVICLRKCPYR